MVAWECDISILGLLFLDCRSVFAGASNQEREMFRFNNGIPTRNDG
jgi:hypothetical protein